MCSGATSVSYVTQVLGMFHLEEVYAFTNDGASACALTGYPSVEAYHVTANGGPTQPVDGPLALAVSDGGSPVTAGTPASVDLAPGSSADVVLAFNGDSNDGSCGTSIANLTDITLTPPGSTQASGLLTWAFNMCPSDGDNQIWVSPVMTPTAAHAAITGAG
ncbi:MAG: DUF4232 domain-containing protein [Solirubrobacteraceae bacterium]